MAGLNSDTPIPTEIKLHQKSRFLELAFENGARYELSYEFLRVFTPSAEARGHAPGQETLQVGKRDVEILGIEPVGNYAIKPVFSDGHDSGLFSWDMLRFPNRNMQYPFESQTDMHPVMPALQLMISLNTFSDLQMKAPFSLAMQQAIPVMYRMTKQTL